MDTKAFLELYGRDRCKRLAKEAGTNFPYFMELVVRKRRPSVDLAKRLIEASGHELDFVSLLNVETNTKKQPA